MIDFERTVLNDDGLPVVWRMTRGNGASIDDVCAWLGEQREAVERVLAEDGALLLRGFEAIASPADFERVLGVLAPDLMDYVGGTSPRRVVRGRIMTATELPATFSIPLHQEMSYTDNPPDRVAFFCQVPPARGGQTTLGDMRRITARIAPELRARWKAHGVQLRRTLPSSEAVHKKPGVAKAWPEVFDTTDRERVEQIALERGWKFTWLEDDSVQLWQEIRPATKVHPRTGAEVWFNQAHVFAPITTLEWARQDDRREDVQRLEQALAEHPEMVDRVFHGDGTVVDDAEVLQVYRAHAGSVVPHQWQKADVLLLDNTLVGHGRAAFQGERLVLAALIRERPAA